LFSPISQKAILEYFKAEWGSKLKINVGAW
jgi:hypothetical protein